MNWTRMLDQKPKWILRRVKRVVPQPEQLYPVLKRLFDSYGHIQGYNSGLALFDKEAWRKVHVLLEAVQHGQVSDPPGYSFYYKIGVHKDVLPLYRCTRGANSIEGGVHQNIIRNFASFA